MRNTIILSIIFMAACSTAPKQPAAPTYKVVSINSAMDSIKYDTIKIGTLNEGEIIKGKFAFKNETDKPVIIESMIAGCGCLNAIREENPVIKPGEENMIGYEFNSKGRFGWELKSFDIITSDKKITRIYIEANVLSSEK